MRRRDVVLAGVFAPFLQLPAGQLDGATAKADSGAPFNNLTVRQLARDLAQKPYQAPSSKLPPELKDLSYDQYRMIRFLPQRAWWRADHLPFEIQFFHRGFFFTDRVDLFEVDQGRARLIPYSPDLFSFSDVKPPDPNVDIGFAGFRLHYPISRPDYHDEVAVLDPVRVAWVFAGTMALLVAPKLLGFLALIIRRSERSAYGGALQAFFSMFAETLISALIAPIMMWMQSVAVLQVLRGRDAGWSAQQRDDASMPFRVILFIYAWPTAAGIFLAAAAYAVSLPLLFWMSPVILGLLLAVPLVDLTSGSSIGHAARRLGLLAVPEERDPPEVLKRANELGRTATTAAVGVFSIWQELREDPELWAAHHEALQESDPRRPGEIDVDLLSDSRNSIIATALRKPGTSFPDRKRMRCSLMRKASRGFNRCGTVIPLASREQRKSRTQAPDARAFIAMTARHPRR
jgi:hypothetical protein